MDANLLNQMKTDLILDPELQGKVLQMTPVSSKAKRFVRPCKVTGCKNSVNSRGLCCSCTSLLKVRLKNGEINKDQYNSLLDPKRQGRKRSAQFDEWMKQTLLEKQFNNEA